MLLQNVTVIKTCDNHYNMRHNTGDTENCY